MAGISRYEKVALGLTAAFVLFTGGWFFATQRQTEPYTVTVTASAPTASTSAAERVPGEDVSSDDQQEKPQSLLEGEKININTASALDLERLPGIGEKRAQDIVAYREEHGPFQSVEELDNVSGIGTGILSGLRDYVTVEIQEPEQK